MHHTYRLAGRWSLAVVVAMAPVGCATQKTTEPGVVGVDRKQALWLSSADVDQASAKAYADLVGQAQQQQALNRNPQYLARVRAIAGRLIPATGAFRQDAPEWKWEVNVIESPEVNAWCMPGGKIAVYSGLIDKLQPTDDELAAVMGHEIAHALREHGREQASQTMATQLGLQLGGALLGAKPGQLELANLMSQLTINLPHSRRFETEADRVGVELAARAGYNPQAALSLWDKMKSAGGGSPPQWLSTHPSHETRQRDLSEYAQRVAPLYQAAVTRPRG